METNFEKYHITVSKEELTNYKCVNYTGGATVVETDNALNQALDHLEKARIVGFDTETRPSFRRGVMHTVALMQLASPEKVFLIRLNKLGLPPRLKSFLEDKDILKVGLSIHDDFHNLNKLQTLDPQGFVDLQTYVKPFHIADNSLTKIYCVIFGERISKGQRLTNWEAETLTEAQINYAAFDAIACIRIYDYLQSGKFDPSASPFLRPIPEPEPTAEH